jgi:integrase
MIGLDTNVLVRYLTQDDPVLSRKAREIIERRLTEEKPGFASIVAMVETVGFIAETTQARTAQLEFRDQPLVLLDGALGIRRGELGALRWQDCELERNIVQIRHFYYWRCRGILKTTKTEASAKPLPMRPALKQALLEWRTQSHRTNSGDFLIDDSRLPASQQS